MESLITAGTLNTPLAMVLQLTGNEVTRGSFRRSKVCEVCLYVGNRYLANGLCDFYGTKRLGSAKGEFNSTSRFHGNNLSAISRSTWRGYSWCHAGELSVGSFEIESSSGSSTEQLPVFLSRVLQVDNMILQHRSSNDCHYAYSGRSPCAETPTELSLCTHSRLFVRQL